MLNTTEYKILGMQMEYKLLRIFFLIWGFSVVYALDSIDFTSPLVFDPVFYVNIHGDLANLKTIQSARDHWLKNGIPEGRQGSGQFHSKQYLYRYPDLAKAYHTDYHSAIKHYLTFGQTEHRLGYIEGGYNGRYTISNGRLGDLFLIASARIDSLVWDHKEFINAWDHGREIQMVINAIPYGECFNPTEAGGASDYRSDSTKSLLKNITANEKELKTTVLPAFWIRAGSHETNNKSKICQRGSPAVNTEDTYHHEFSKDVTLGCFGMDNCIKYVSYFTVAGKWPRYDFINLVTPAVYLTGNFTQLLNYNPENQQIQPYTKSIWPAVRATPDNKYALGMYAPVGQDSDKFMYYGANSFDGSFAWKTNTASVVFRKLELPVGSTRNFSYLSYICVGSLNMVAECLRRVQQKHPHI